jgi:hypothetical protein
MSRSYKKHPFCAQQNGSRKFYKRYANKVVRNTLDVPNGKAYRKCYETWDIFDYRSYSSPQRINEWIRMREVGRCFPGMSDFEIEQYWHKCNTRK